jgi:hypothetical protein
MNLINKCRAGDHSLRVIHQYSGIGFDCDEEIFIRWCNVCGAIVKDIEVDNRLYPGKILKMQFPEALICIPCSPKDQEEIRNYKNEKQLK